MPSDLFIVPFLPQGAGLWVIVFSALFLISVLGAMIVLAQYGRRDAIIDYLEKEAARPLRRTGRFDNRALADLIELGKQSEPGPDKGLVLEALNTLIEKLIECRHYRGDSLETLVMGLVDMFASTTNSGSPQNFRIATEVLYMAVHAQEVPTIPSDARSDLPILLNALSTLGQTALIHIQLTTEIDRTVTTCVDALGLTMIRHSEFKNEVSQALFEIGSLAVERTQMLIANAALEKLLTLAQHQQPANGELTADLLGLMAHFWTAPSETARAHVEKRLVDVQHYLAHPLLTALEAAQEHCAVTTKFQTADKLLHMKTDLTLTASPEKLLPPA
jgi:hypothetical protein